MQRAEQLYALEASSSSINPIPAVGYAGDVDASVAYEWLQRHAGVLVDVRSEPEWHCAGVPTLAGTPSSVLPLAWKLYPQWNINLHFLSQLQAAVAVTTPVFFLCKTGGRSADAATAATAAGYHMAYNICDGMEGPHDAQGRRGRIAGWKAAALPWEQS